LTKILMKYIFDKNKFFIDQIFPPSPHHHLIAYL
jgi:hypothetical protein